MKTILITGSSRGIGAQIARQAFLSGTYHVVIQYRAHRARADALAASLETIARENPERRFGKLLVQYADVTREADVDALFSAAEAAFGRVDVLVNNAGISSFRLFTDLTLSEWNETMATNVTGAFLCCRRALPKMVHEKYGRIVNVSSVWGLCGASCEVHYSASKAALIGLTKALAKEVAPSGITVNCVAPGVIDTEMNAALKKEDLDALRDETPLGRIGTVSDVAKTVLFLASDDASFLTGQVVSPNGGLVI